MYAIFCCGINKLYSSDTVDLEHFYLCIVCIYLPHSLFVTPISG